MTEEYQIDPDDLVESSGIKRNVIGVDDTPGIDELPEDREKKELLKEMRSLTEELKGVVAQQKDEKKEKAIAKATRLLTARQESYDSKTNTRVETPEWREYQDYLRDQDVLRRQKEKGKNLDEVRKDIEANRKKLEKSGIYTKLTGANNINPRRVYGQRNY